VRFESSCFTWGFIPVFGNKGLWKEIVVYMLVEDYDTIKEMFYLFQ
jgi:hypothetical protein